MTSVHSSSSFGANDYEGIPRTPPILVRSPHHFPPAKVRYKTQRSLDHHNSADDMVLPPQMEQMAILDQYLNDSLTNESRNVSSLSLARSVSYTGGSGSGRPYLGRRLSRSLPELREIKNHLTPLFEHDDEVEDDDVDTTSKKDAWPIWNKKLDFILCGACQALGLGNLWRFPYFCYINGGGCFLVAYLILMVFCGIPVLCLEYALGQMSQRAAIAAFGKLAPIVKGVGVAGILTSFWILSYYSTINAWALFYFFNSFFSLPPWSHCNNTWNSDNCKICEANKKVTVLDLRSSGPPQPIPTADLVIDAMTPNATTPFIYLTELTNVSSTPITSLLCNQTSPDLPIAVLEFFDKKLLEVRGQLDSPGELRWELLASVLFSWVIAYFLLRKTAAFTGRTTYCLAVISYLLLLALLLRSVMLDGSDGGLKFLFTPHLGGFRSAKVWLCALAQTFHSTSAVLGTSIAMSSSNKHNNNVIRDAITTAFISTLTAVIIGSLVFATLGYIAFQWSINVDQVLYRDPGMVFVAFSELLASMPLSPFWCVIVFLIIFSLGMDSQVSLLETVVGTIEDGYGYFVKTHFHSHQLFLLVTCIASLLIGGLYVTQGGICFIQLTDHYAGVILVVAVALLEVGSAGCVYGGTRLATKIREVTGDETGGPSCYFSWCWSFITPAIIVAILGFSLAEMDVLTFRQEYKYPSWGEGLGWLIVFVTLMFVPLIAMIAVRKTPKTNICVRITTASKSRLDDCLSERVSSGPPKEFVASDPMHFETLEAKLKKETLPSIPELDVLNITHFERETCI